MGIFRKKDIVFWEHKYECLNIEVTLCLDCGNPYKDTPVAKDNFIEMAVDLNFKCGQCGKWITVPPVKEKDIIAWRDGGPVEEILCHGCVVLRMTILVVDMRL